MGEGAAAAGRCASFVAMLISRGLGIGLGVLADRVLGDPKKHHPVAWFGTWAAAAEKRTYDDSTAAGAAHVAVVVAPVAAAAVLLERATRDHPGWHVAATALTTWAVLGASSLAREGRLMADSLDAQDLDGARARVNNLCSRDPEQLDEQGVCRAATESMAENTADAAVASLLWGAVAGIPGMVAHRCLNTLDAMIGYRNDRYLRFGTVAAKLDDAADLVPARVTGATACLLAGTVDGSRADAWRVMRRDAHRHPSPNGGWCESAFAGALGVQLGGRNVYFGREETRDLLGDGQPPRAAELRRASQLVGHVTWAVTGGVVVALTLLGKARR